MTTLKLTLKKQWFDMIVSGEKIEEYREIKNYWISRFSFNSINYAENLKKYDFVEFTNGYSSSSPKAVFEFVSIHIGKGNIEWGASEDQQYFIIKIGKLVFLKQ